MGTGPHLGGGPVFQGRPRPCRSSPRGRTSATASVHGGISSPPGMPDAARFAGNRRASCVWRGCGARAEYVTPAEEYAGGPTPGVGELAGQRADGEKRGCSGHERDREVQGLSEGEADGGGLAGENRPDGGQHEQRDQARSQPCDRLPSGAPACRLAGQEHLITPGLLVATYEPRGGEQPPDGPEDAQYAEDAP